MAARVKEPRYALGALAGLAYFGWIFWFGLIGTGPGGDMPAEVGLPALAEALLPVPLAVLAVGWWMSGRTHMALAFTPAESQILFQAPIGRETLLQYKLVRSQLSIVPVSIMVAVFFGGAIGIPYRTGVPSIWLLFTTIHLHQIASGLIRATWSHQGPAGLRRQWLPILVLAGAFGAVVWALWPLGAAYETATGMAQFLVAVEVAFAHPAAVIVFMPFRIALGPLMAVEPMAWLGAMGGAVALMAAHYVWIIRIDAAFEETAAEAGIELLEITTAFKEGRLGMLRAAKGRRLPRPWFRLRPEGHPAVAIYWKGLTGFTRSTGLTQGLAMAVVFLGFWALLRAMTGKPDEAAAAAMALPGVLGFVSLLFGPLFLRNDLRTDLGRLEILKTLPLSGRDVVAAEILGSAVSLTVVSGYFFTLTFVFFQLSQDQPLVDWRPWAALAGTWVLLLPVSMIAMGIQNCLVVVFPAWMDYGPSKAQGIDQMGGMMLSLAITAVLLTLALLVPLICGGAVAFRLFPLIGFYAATPAALAVIAALIAEIVVLVILLGEAYDELDASEEGLMR